MYRGRYQQGDIISFRFPFTDINDAPALPIEQVRWKIIDPNGVTTYYDYAPIGDTDIIGSFWVGLRITTFFATPGRYTIWVQAKMSSTLYRTFFMNFRIISGGVSGGGVHSQYFWNRPEASYIVWSNENGEIISGRNPSLS